MKKILWITASALIIAMSASGCGKTNTSNNTPAENDVQQQIENYGKNASDNVDMKKIDGIELKAAEPEGDVKDDGKIGAYEVSVDDAKMIDYQDSKVLLVSFEFKNNSSAAVNFSGVTSVDAVQGESPLPPVVVTGVEGFDSSTLAQNVEKGKKIKVQRAYKLADETTPVTVTVQAFDTVNNEGMVSKTFNIQ